MAMIDEMSEGITKELERNLQQLVRSTIEKYLIGGKTNGNGTRESRNRIIIEAVAKHGQANVDDVARATGLDKRGVGSSLHYLAAAGKLKHAGAGRYKVVRGH